MVKKDSLERLEQAAVARNPALATRLRPGLTEDRVKRALSRVKVTGEISPIIALYTWKDGMDLTSDPDISNFNDWKLSRSLFPGKPYFFICLETALGHLGHLKAASAKYPQLSEGVGRYFPVFWDGSTEELAIDVKPSNRNRVLILESRSDEPFREAYGSFEEFITDAIRANEENRPLRCFQKRGNEISDQDVT